MSEVINLFSHNIYRKIIKNSKHINYFINELNKEIVENKGNIVSNVGGFQTKTFFNIKDKKILNDVFLKPSLEFSKKLNPVKNIELNLAAYWINANRTFDYNLLHLHTGFLSGVYYLKVPKNSGKIIFYNGDMTKMSLVHANFFNHSNYWSRYSFEPKEGELYIFPSNTLHYVEPNRSNNTRMSVAFNINLTIK
jgi:uncharacterized protein (TIGR02466 family)